MRMRRRRLRTIRRGLGSLRERGGLSFPAWPKETGAWLFVAAGVAGLCLLYVWQSAQILDLTAKRESAKEKLTSTEEVNRWLEFQIGEAFSLDRVSQIARTQLHMVEPTTVRYVTVPAEEPRP